MNLQQLRYLVATADTGTMTAAARDLHVAQPALSRAMKAFEAELGVALFEPEGRSVRLTAAGLEVVAAARTALAAVDDVYAAARAHTEPAEALVVVTTPTLEPVFAGHLLPAYYALHPGTATRVLRAGGRQEVVAAVRAGDAVVGLCDLPAPDDLELVPLGEFEVVLLSPPGSDLPDRIAWDDLGGLPLILPSAGSTRRAEYEAFFGATGIRPVVALESDERGSWLAGVLAGIGSVLWYGERATHAIERGAVVSGFTPPLRRSVGFVHRRGGLSPAADELIAAACKIGLPDWVHPAAT